MKQFFKILFWFSVCSIALLIIVPIVFHLLPLEFTKNNDEIIFNNIWFFGLPAAILLTLTGTLKLKNSVGEKILKIILTILVALLPIVFAFATALDGLCAWTTDKVLFEKINEPSVKIVSREYGCGAVDTGSPTHNIFKIKYFTSHLILVSPIDTTKINKAIWRRNNNND